MLLLLHVCSGVLFLPSSLEGSSLGYTVCMGAQRALACADGQQVHALPLGARIAFSVAEGIEPSFLASQVKSSITDFISAQLGTPPPRYFKRI